MNGIALGVVISVKLELVEADSAGLAIGEGGGSLWVNSIVVGCGVDVMDVEVGVAVVISEMVELEEVQCVDQ